ncbi:Uncharacterised protein [Yersinia frederiksenii]|nr:Uncharacterised protein [Yersinia frederiksenii]
MQVNLIGQFYHRHKMASNGKVLFWHLAYYRGIATLAHPNQLAM